MGELNYQLRILTDEALKDVEKSKSVFKRITDNAVSGGEAIDAAYTEAAKKIEQAFEDLNEAGEKTRVEIKRLSASLKEYEQAAGDAFMRGDDATFRAMNEKIAGVQSAIRDANSNIKAIDETTLALEKQRQELDADYKAAKKQADAQTSMRTQMRKLREELIAMEQSGKRNTAEYREMQQQLGKLTDAYGDAARQAQVFAHDNANLQGVISGLSGLAGAFSVGQGAIGMFAGESENLTKVLTRVQSIMAVTNGLQTVANTLNKDSAFRLTTVAKAQELWSKGIKNTGTALVKMGMSANAARTAAIALQSAMTLGIGAAIAGAIALITKLVNKWKEAKEVQEAFNSEVAKNAAKPIAAFQEMAYQWNQLDMEGKEKFVRDNAKAFDELGVSVRNVADAENLLNKNANVFIEMQMAKAKAAAARKLAEDDAEKYVRKSLELDEKMEKEQWGNAEAAVKKLEKAIKSAMRTGSYTAVGEYQRQLNEAKEAMAKGEQYWLTWERSQYDQYDAELKVINKGIEDRFKSATEHVENAKKLAKDANLEETKIIEGSVEWYKKQISILNADLDKLTDVTGVKAKEIKDEIAKNQAEIDKILGNNKEQKTSSGRDWLTEQMAQAKSQYALVASMMSSTDELTRKHGEELYEELKKNGVDYLDFLIKLREQYKGKLSDSQSIAIDAAIADLTKSQQKAQKDNQTDYLQGLLDTYKTYDEERKAIDDKYREAKTALEFLGEKERAEMVQKEWDKAVKDIDEKFGKTIFKESAALAKAMENAGNQTKKSLKESLKTLKAVRAYKQGDKDALQGTGVTEDQAKKMSLEDLQRVYDQLIAVQDEYDKKSKYPFRNLIEGFKALKAAETAEKENNDSEAIYQKARAQQMFANAVDEGVVVVGKLAEGMKTLGDATGNVEWQKFAEGLSDAVDIAQSAVSGAKTGGVWGALASVAMNIGSKVINSSAETAAQEKQREADQLDFQTRYNKLLSERNYLEQEYAGIMGADRMGRAAAAWQEAQDSLAKYNAAVGKSMGELELQSRNYTTSFMNPLEGIETKATEILGKAFGQENVEKVEQFANKAANVLTLGISKGLLGIGAEKSNYNDSIKSAMERGLNELQAMQVQTKERKWYKIGSKDKYESLYDIAPQLWGGDINGEFDVEAAKELLQTNKDLSDVQKQQLENVIGLKEQYDEAMKVVKEMAQEIVGNIGNDMTDAIVTAVETGADAWDAFEASGANAIKNLGKQMVQSLIYDNWLKKYEDQIQKAIGSGDKQGVIDIIGQIGQEMPQMYEQGQALLKEVYDAGERMNYQMYQIDEQNREASAKGIAQASQDSIDELNGRMTAVQGHTFAISQNTATLTQHTAQMLRLLTGISGDTARLENIEVRINAMQSDISNMNTRGIIVRQ